MSDRPPVLERMTSAPLVRQFVKYAIVGALNTALFFGLYNGALTLGANIATAYAIAFLPPNVNGFLLNKRWTFRDPRRHQVVRQYLRFAAFTVFGLLINEAIVAVAHSQVDHLGLLGANLAALAALPVQVLWNFTAYRRWTFQHGPAPAAS